MPPDPLPEVGAPGGTEDPGHYVVSLSGGVSVGPTQSYPPTCPIAGQFELTFLMMFPISLPRNSSVALALSNVDFVCA